jgi:hypothetical protein
VALGHFHGCGEHMCWAILADELTEEGNWYSKGLILPGTLTSVQVLSRSGCVYYTNATLHAVEGCICTSRGWSSFSNNVMSG